MNNVQLGELYFQFYRDIILISQLIIPITAGIVLFSSVAFDYVQDAETEFFEDGEIKIPQKTAVKLTKYRDILRSIGYIHGLGKYLGVITCISWIMILLIFLFETLPFIGQIFTIGHYRPNLQNELEFFISGQEFVAIVLILFGSITCYGLLLRHLNIFYNRAFLKTTLSINLKHLYHETNNQV